MDIPPPPPRPPYGDVRTSHVWCCARHCQHNKQHMQATKQHMQATKEIEKALSRAENSRKGLSQTAPPPTPQMTK